MRLHHLFLSALLLVSSAAVSAQSVASDGFRLREVDIDEMCGSFKNHQSAYRVKCDYPMNDEPAADAVRQWINQTANYWDRGLYTGDMKEPIKLFQHYMEHFRSDNSSEKIEQHLVAESGTGSDAIAWNESEEPTWLTTFTYKKEYVSAKVVSYSFSWFGYFVGNATSNATKQDASFSRIDGHRLSWEMFTSKDAVVSLVQANLKQRYGEGADLYGNGIPAPKEPLFLADGIRFDYGNYSVAEAHYYEENGTYPYAFLSYDKVRHLLTAEARQLLQQ
ncbi:MAG: hypothetical protein J6I60_07215 [Bacteroidaceae bacterium]|nr:hypothetical protein [Bacteroidaceae bacterium]